MSWKDGVIAGTGNSRYLKTVSNFMSLYPTYADFVAALVAGTLPIDLNRINAAGRAQIGTALAKATLLDDTTATATGGSETVSQAILYNATVGSDLQIKKKSFSTLN
ncbi:MAG: hypothetical protein VB071_09060 [Lawsonibacter sp.]|nr:hypothetical protein [Lawsonibacter sp.]